MNHSTLQIEATLRSTDWQTLAEQKAALVDLRATPTFNEEGVRYRKLSGLIHFLDALMDSAEADGFLVVFLTDPEEGGDEG